MPHTKSGSGLCAALLGHAPQSHPHHQTLLLERPSVFEAIGNCWSEEPVTVFCEQMASCFQFGGLGNLEDLAMASDGDDSENDGSIPKNWETQSHLVDEQSGSEVRGLAKATLLLGPARDLNHICVTPTCSLGARQAPSCQFPVTQGKAKGHVLRKKKKKEPLGFWGSFIFAFLSLL